MSVNERECFGFKQFQAETFPDELRRLQQKRSLPSTNALLLLNPFLDVDGLIRVATGTRSPPISNETSRSPIITSGC